MPARFLEVSRSWKGAALAAGLALASVACSGTSNDEWHPGPGPHATGGAASTGGSNMSGGSLSSGGSSAGGGTASSGGSDSGGDSATGGVRLEADGGSSAGGYASGGLGSQGTGGRPLGVNECSDEVSCDVGSTCYPPGSERPHLCGAPDWCGECQCPPRVQLPAATNRACSQDTPCPDASNTEPVAHLCDSVSGTCTECLNSDDCPTGRPFCGTDAYSGARACFECESNADCPQERPRCSLDQGNWGSSTAGNCVECLLTADCSIGVCSPAQTCVPSCTSDEDCGPNKMCNEQQRCQTQPCVPGECSSASSCHDGGAALVCVPLTCARSDDCGAANYCVSGSCFEQPGRCQFDAVP